MSYFIYFVLLEKHRTNKNKLNVKWKGVFNEAITFLKNKKVPGKTTF